MKKIYALLGVLLLAACGGGATVDQPVATLASPTPTVDYIEGLDVYSSQHQDSFLNMLAMNYRSFALYNARTSGYPDIGERFAQKAVAAFSGETPYPENVDDWGITNNNLRAVLGDAHNDLIDALKNDASALYPELAAEAQAKFDCWVAASASCQDNTAAECRGRFEKAIAALQNNLATGTNTGQVVRVTTQKSALETGRDAIAGGQNSASASASAAGRYYPSTTGLQSATVSGRTREGVVIVNNVNIPQNLIQPVPVPPAPAPIVFNQNIVAGARQVPVAPEPVAEPAPTQDNYVTREEFMLAMQQIQAELAAINARLDNISQPSDTTVIKVQQIPAEPKQRVMEQVLEIHFDFDKAIIRPEYESIIRKLAQTCRENQNVKVTVVGHTDTVGSAAYNFALGGKRAKAVRQILINYGIPASQIVTVSAGEKDLKVPTGDNVPNAKNRRAVVTKEVRSTVQPAPQQPPMVRVINAPTPPSGRIMGFPVAADEPCDEYGNPLPPPGPSVPYGMPTPLYGG
ncbi:MAG: OmpA family protein [Proteobacteria bacterium]|nr:OmpA family protein [Pseudomonadota bacterium]